MNLQTAMDLAAKIESEHAPIRVVAIGRFCPPDEITAATPWAVSVFAASRMERPRVIRSLEAFDSMLEILNPKPTPAKKARTDGLVQPGLF